MTTLAFDTCFGACSAALRFRGASGEWIVREDYREMATGHAETLLPMIEHLVAEAGLRFGDLTRLAVTNGPGSFTGVRIGLSAARGLKLALGLPVSARSSLSVMAARAQALLAGGPFEGAGKASVLTVCVDARGGQVYAESFAAESTRPLHPAALATIAELAERLRGERNIIVGSGAGMLAEAIAQAGGDAVAMMPALQPHARHLALLAAGDPPTANLDPMYLRNTDAKPMASAGPP